MPVTGIPFSYRLLRKLTYNIDKTGGRYSFLSDLKPAIPVCAEDRNVHRPQEIPVITEIL